MKLVMSSLMMSISLSTGLYLLLNNIQVANELSGWLVVIMLLGLFFAGLMVFTNILMKAEK
jgi:uncharacterized membrane protein